MVFYSGGQLAGTRCLAYLIQHCQDRGVKGPARGAQASGMGAWSLVKLRIVLVNVANRFGCLRLKLPDLGDKGYRDSIF